MEKSGTSRVFKKTSANSVLTLYLGSRDLICQHGVVEPLRGVIFIDPKFMCSQKVYGQLTLTFRYGREDEEVMGLKFCNEAVIALKQIWPKVNYDEELITPLQQALLERLGHGSHPFTLEIGMLAPPSVQLVPAKKYNGAPIGTSYDVRVYMNDLNDEKFQRRTTVKLGIRLMHKISSDLKAIQETNPIFTSIPKTIRLRLSPKQIKFHYLYKNHHQTTKSSSDTTSCTDNGVGGSSETATIGYKDEGSNHLPHNPAMPVATKPRPTSITPDFASLRTTQETTQPNDISGSSSTIGTSRSLPSSLKVSTS
ncbi:unnamed protein product [Hermetia illucens]|uniref:Arrestin-like N-terminal domain-containing protein n=1 Tax=Hermetia illucens TaxID=343691 RepID=A0A7R8Z4V9_HERIL|nr:unnamed protein product [Hermetia illucens]